MNRAKLAKVARQEQLLLRRTRRLAYILKVAPSEPRLVALPTRYRPGSLAGLRPYDFGIMFEEAIRVRFPLIDLWLIFLLIILLVLVVRELIY